MQSIAVTPSIVRACWASSTDPHLDKVLVKTGAYFLPIVANYCRLLP